VSPVKKTTTVYCKNFQYTNDTLTQASVPDGRARWQKQHYLNGDSAWHFFFDYFLKDHLGNTRVVLTNEKDTAYYRATMELSAVIVGLIGDGILYILDSLFSVEYVPFFTFGMLLYYCYTRFIKAPMGRVCGLKY
jgi:hypothetical protein